MLEESPFLYRVFGMLVESDIPIPDLVAVQDYLSATNHIRISSGKTPREIRNAAISRVLFQANQHEWLIRTEQVADANILVSNGNQITINRHSLVQISDGLMLYLLGTAMGAILFQRGILPLHASTVARADGLGISFMGASGAGKSSLAASLLRNEFHLLSDDLTAVEVYPKRVPTVSVGIPRLKLWEKSCRLLDVTIDGLDQIRPNVRKYYVKTPNGVLPESATLHTAYILAPDDIDEPRLVPLEGIGKFHEIQAHLYRVALSEAQPVWPFVSPKLFTLSSQIRVRIIYTPRDQDWLSEVSKLILTDIDS